MSNFQEVCFSLSKSLGDLAQYIDHRNPRMIEVVEQTLAAVSGYCQDMDRLCKASRKDYSVQTDTKPMTPEHR